MMPTADRDAVAAMMGEARRQLGPAPQAALALAQRLLALAPASVEAQFLHGAALRRCDDPMASLAVLAPLAASQPGAWGVQFEHGMALAALGRCEDAAAALARATAANPGSSLAWHALGDQLAMLGDAAGAATAQGRAVAGSVADPALLSEAQALFAGGSAAELGQRFGLYLSDLAALRLLADAGMRLGAFDAVEPLLATALARAPHFLPAAYALAMARYRLDSGAAALATVLPLVAARPETAAFRTLRAAIHMQLGQGEAAVAHYEAALRLFGDDAPALAGLGHALRSVGRQADAVAAYRRAIAIAPGFGEAWWSLANLKTWRFAAADVAALQGLVADAGIAGPDRAYLHFALAKALEDGGDHGAAFAHYSQGNAGFAATSRHDAAAHHDFIRRSMATFSAAFFAARTGTGCPATDPIFVLGLPRSGSTLVEQILASHSLVEGASELPDLTAIARRLARNGRYPEVLAQLAPGDLAAMGGEYLERTRIHRPLGRALFVDKFPGNVLHIGLIQLILPNARIIDARRAPMATCVSLFKQAFAAGQAYSHDLGDLGRYYADYVDLMTHFETVLPGRVHRIDHERLVDDAETEVRRLLSYCGLDFEAQCLRFHETRRVIRTASSEQVRQPLNRRGIDQWRHFEPWLQPLVDVLKQRGIAPV